MFLTRWRKLALRRLTAAARRARWQMSYRRPRVERLEDRLAPAVAWDGGAGTLRWGDAANWEGDRLPGPADAVQIGAAFAAVTITSSEDVTINSLTTEAAIQIQGGTFSIAAAST